MKRLLCCFENDFWVDLNWCDKKTRKQASAWVKNWGHSGDSEL
jgi:hypothetical protein